METAPVEAGSVETAPREDIGKLLPDSFLCRSAPAESRRTSREERHTRRGRAAGEWGKDAGRLAALNRFSACRFQRGGEVRRERRGDVDRRARYGMGKGETGGVQELPLEPEVQGWKRRRRSRRRPAHRPRGCAAPGNAVHRVASDGKVDRREMHPDLVRPPGLEPDKEERVPRQKLLELEVRHGRTRRGRVERVAEPVVPVAADRRVDRPAPRPRPAGDEREVLACQCPAPHEPLQPLVRLL